MASVARDPRLATNTWVVPRSLLDKVLTLGVWIAVTWLVYAASFPLTPPVAQLPYILFIVYFATLCLRMLTVPLWANNTIRLLERCSREPVGLPATCPQFLVFIAAYKAQESIQVVLEALRHQTYPADKFRVYVITQAAENFEKSAQFQDVSRRVRSAVHKGGRREETSHADLRVLAALIQRLPVPAGPSGPISVLLSHAIAGKLLQWTKPKLSRALAKLVLLQFLRADSEGRQLESASRDLASDGLTLRSTAVRLILQFVPRCTSIASQVIADFARILGLPPHISVFADPAKPWKLAATVAGDRVTTRLQSPILNLMLRRDLGNWLDGVSEIGETCRRTLMSLPDFEADLRKGYDAGVRTCPEAVEDALVRCGPNFHHICRKKVGGGKPESLNSAYFQLLEEEPELLGDDTFFVVIDADSLLCSSSLAVAAREIRSRVERRPADRADFDV